MLFVELSGCNKLRHFRFIQSTAPTLFATYFKTTFIAIVDLCNALTNIGYTRGANM
jgi:hypothetical protein